MSVNQIQLRGFGTRAFGTLFHKMNHDLRTINTFELSLPLVNFFFFLEVLHIFLEKRKIIENTSLSKYAAEKARGKYSHS